jgi:hypothetical protein
MSQPAATVGTEPAKGNGGDLVVWSWTRRPFGLACSLYLWLLLSAGPAAASHTLAPTPLPVFSSLCKHRQYSAHSAPSDSSQIVHACKAVVMLYKTTNKASAATQAAWL